MKVYAFRAGFHGFEEAGSAGGLSAGMEVFPLGQGLVLVSDGDGWIRGLAPTAEVLREGGEEEGMCHVRQLVYGGGLCLPDGECREALAGQRGGRRENKEEDRSILEEGGHPAGNGLRDVFSSAGHHLWIPGGLGSGKFHS